MYDCPPIKRSHRLPSFIRLSRKHLPWVRRSHQVFPPWARIKSLTCWSGNLVVNWHQTCFGNLMSHRPCAPSYSLPFVRHQGSILKDQEARLKYLIAEKWKLSRTWSHWQIFVENLSHRHHLSQISYELSIPIPSSLLIRSCSVASQEKSTASGTSVTVFATRINRVSNSFRSSRSLEQHNDCWLLSTLFPFNSSFL